MSSGDTTTPRKIALKKVRAGFLNRTPENSEKDAKESRQNREIEENEIVRPVTIILDPRIDPLPKGEYLLLQPPLGTVEYERKLYSDYGLRNIFQRVSNV